MSIDLRLSCHPGSCVNGAGGKRTRMDTERTRYRGTGEEEVEVSAYSGYQADERPLHFSLGERRLVVKEIVCRWRGPEDDFFRVLAHNGQEYLLKRERTTDIWYVVPDKE